MANLEDYLKEGLGFTYRDNMATINKELFKGFIDKGFFDEAKHTKQVVEKLDTRGLTVEGKKVGMVARILTQLCQDGLLEREKDREGDWRYKKS